MFLPSWVGAAIALLIARVLWVLLRKTPSSPRPQSSPVSVMAVLGSGVPVSTRNTR